MNNTEFMLIKMDNENNFIFDEEDEKIFEKAIAGESPYSIYSTGILQDDNLLFKATKVLRPYKNEGITLIINGGPIAGLVVVINVCHMLGIHLSLAYYNTKTGEFDLQQVMCMKVCMKESCKEISKGMEEVETQNTKEISKGMDNINNQRVDNISPLEREQLEFERELLEIETDRVNIMEEVETQNTIESFNEKYKKEFDDTFKGYGDKFALERKVIALMCDNFNLYSYRFIYDRKEEKEFLEANQKEAENLQKNLANKALLALKPYENDEITLVLEEGDFTTGLITVINTCYMLNIDLTIISYHADENSYFTCLEQTMYKNKK